MSAESREKLRMHRLLKSRLRQVLQAQALGMDEARSRQALGADYAVAKQKGIELDPGLDRAIQKVLGKQGLAQALGKGRGTDNLVNGLKGNFGGGGGGGGLGALGGGGGGGNLFGTSLNGGGGFGGGGGTVHAAKPMSDQDHQTLAEAIQQKGGFPDLIGGWRQTREGNCASVATIKAAMQQYGSDVFKDVQRGPNGYEVTLQDGKKVSLSNDEMAYARGQAQFAGGDPRALAYAELCYGVIAKNHAQTHGASLQASCFDLNNGFDPRQSGRLLGLGNQMTQFNGQSGVVWNNSHAVFKNGYYDLWGRASSSFGGHSAYSFAQQLPGWNSAHYTVKGNAPEPPSSEASNPQGGQGQPDASSSEGGSGVSGAEENSTQANTLGDQASAQPANSGLENSVAQAGGDSGGTSPQPPQEPAPAAT